MKIKTFKFYLSNCESLHKVLNSKYYDASCDKLQTASESEIDNIVNDFINDKTIVDIKINDYTMHRHNNAGSDTIVRTYTILYN